MPNQETLRYLESQFGAYYADIDMEVPPDADQREWGFIPWPSADDGARMIRHRSLLQMGEPADYFNAVQPRHVYCTAARWEKPSAGSMTEKGWQNADLVFDIDADHLEGVEDASLSELLAYGKEELVKLLDILETDFGYEDLTIVFSGGRGYHVHVRDDHVKQLEQAERQRISEYITAESVTFDSILTSRSVSGTAGRTSDVDQRVLNLNNGWGARVLETILLPAVEEVREMTEVDAIEYLTQFDGIGDGRAKAIYKACQNSFTQPNTPGIKRGNIDVHGAFPQFAETLYEQQIDDVAPEIDEPVTTDVNRLIRVPGSLHGGTALRVTEIPRDEVEAFTPTVDAVPDAFADEDVTVDVAEATTVEVMEYGEVSAGEQTVPKAVGIHLMARGDANVVPAESA